MGVFRVMLLLVNFLYLVSTVLFIRNFVSAREGRHWPNGVLYAGFLVATLLILYESRVRGVYLPVTGLGQALFFFSWSMVLIYLALAWKIPLDTFGLVLAPLVLAMSTAAFFLPGGETFPAPPLPSGSPALTKAVLARLPALPESRWFAVHVLAAFFAYASFALSFVGALLYLVQNHELKRRRSSTFYHKLPPLEVLETVVYRTIVLGLPLLTGALASGFLWSKEMFGAFWHWEPKFVLSVATWVFYLAILLAHYLYAFRGKKVVLVSILAFGFVLCTFLGVNLFESTLHDFLR